jgi:hypothetical protein
MSNPSLMTDYTIGDDAARRSAWVRYVERTYLMDPATAQRVVFARWLAETGGLTDWPAAARRLAARARPAGVVRG